MVKLSEKIHRLERSMGGPGEVRRLNLEKLRIPALPVPASELMQQAREIATVQRKVGRKLSPIRSKSFGLELEK